MPGDKLKVHVELWDVVVLISSGRNWLYICDSEAIPEILQRRNDFRRDLKEMAMPNNYRKNKAITNG